MENRKDIKFKSEKYIETIKSIEMKELEPQLILVKHEIKKNNIDQNILP